MMSGSWCGQVRSLKISLGLFRDLQVERSNFWLVWPSSVGHVPRGSMILLSTRSCYFIDHDLRDRVNLLIAIYAIVLFHRSRITRSWYFIDCDLRDRFNLVGPGFKPQTKQYNIFIGPGFDSQARLPVSGQCDSWPMSLAPTNGKLRWWGKKPHGRKKMQGDYFKYKT